MRLNKSLFANFTWLATSQGANFVIPIIIYPYVLRIVGVEKFGLVVFAQAVVTYFANIVDYGFSITAVREVSLNRNNPTKLSKIFNHLFTVKILICLLCFGLLTLLVWLIPEWKTEKVLFLSSFSIVVGQLFLPIWFFQGLEKMKGVALMNFLSKAAFVLLVLTLIRSPFDYFLVNFFLGASQTIAGLIAIILVIKKYQLNLKFIGFKKIAHQLKENRSIFFSGFAVFVSNNSNLMILGMIADPVSVGYYGIVDKILLAIRAPAVLLYQTIFPRVCALAEQSFNDVKKLLKAATRLIYIVFIPLGIGVFLLSDHIIRLFAGEYLSEPSNLLRIVCFVPFLAAINIPATHTLLAYNFKRTYVQVTALSAIVNIILNIILVNLFLAEGTALTALITELFLSSTLFFGLATYHKGYNVLSVLNPFDNVG